MTRPRHILRIVVPALAATLVAGCGGGADDPATASAADDDTAATSEPIESVLVIDGKRVGGSTPGDGPAAAAARAQRDAPRDRADGDGLLEDEYEPLPLLADGTIDDGPDPFADSFVPVQAMPIEDDPGTTADISAWANVLRRVDRETWDQWMTGGASSPWQQGGNPTAASLVEIAVERCGGARHVATGVVLDDETVVTNVHVVENAAKRVRVSSARGDSRRIPAMIRYLDVDDDVAVLRVPGLQVEPMAWHTVAGVDPVWGYAYGIAPGGRSGTVRRTPVITSVQETTIDVEQPDGFAEQISERPVQTLVGGVTSGFSGGIVVATNDTSLSTNWGFHGLLRARMGLRADTAAVAVPSRIVEAALDANDRLEEWFEIRPGGCPQWHR